MFAKVIRVSYLTMNELHLKAVISQMLHFQKINNIISHCITNCKFLYDWFRIRTGIKLNIVVGFVIRERGDGGITTGTHAWIEYNNIYYEPSFEWVNSYKYITICDLLNSSIWKKRIDQERENDNDISDNIRNLLIDLEMHSKQVKLLQFGNGEEDCWVPVGFSADDTSLLGKMYYDNLLNFFELQ